MYKKVVSLCFFGLLLIAGIILVSCGDSRTVLSPNTLWPLKVGEKRTYSNIRSVVDSNGNTTSTRVAGNTTIETRAQVQFDCQTTFEVFLTKDCLECYWAPGYPQQVHFFVYDDSGVRTSPGDIRDTWPDGVPFETEHFQTLSSSKSDTYTLLVPNPLSGTAVRSLYQPVPIENSPDYSCIPKAPEDGTAGLWKTDISFGTVTTPVYSGPVLIARYSEGNAPGFSNVDPNCPTGQMWKNDPGIPCDENDAETWYFATQPPYGLVQLVVQHISVLNRFMDGKTYLPGHEETLVLKLTSLK